MNINSILNRELKSKKIPQRKVADALHMDTSTLCRKLNGNRTMYIDEFASICQLLELSADRVLEEANA